MYKNPIIIGSDHAGFEMKEAVRKKLESLGIEVTDAGTKSLESTDYPIYGAKVAKAVADKSFERGIVVCGSGIGISITANRLKGVRASLCVTEEMAEMTRRHNNSNVLALAGGGTCDESTIMAIVDTWLSTDFEGGRHERRVDLIDTIFDSEE